MGTEETHPTRRDTGAETEVAGALEEAAVHAEKTAGRVGWPRGFVRRIAGRP